MDIFKLIYEHDLRLDTLKSRHTDRSTQDTSMTIEDFMKPDPTYSKFYFTGTRLTEEQFGLNKLDRFDEVIASLNSALSSYRCFTVDGKKPLTKAIDDVPIGEAMVLTKENSHSWNLKELSIDTNSNVGHKKESIANLLETDDLLLYKEQAKSGFDLHLFSKKNLYPKMFYPLQEMVDDTFRFFSMNGKRVTSERKFYFETWTLQRPPHGTEEVFKETVL